MNNKHNTLTCSGWGMMPSSLDALVTSSNNINYMAHRSYNALLNSLPENTHYDTAIGWSLGGQILLRLISDHKITFEISKITHFLVILGKFGDYFTSKINFDLKLAKND